MVACPPQPPPIHPAHHSRCVDHWGGGPAVVGVAGPVHGGVHRGDDPVAPGRAAATDGWEPARLPRTCRVPGERLRGRLLRRRDPPHRGPARPAPPPGAPRRADRLRAVQRRHRLLLLLPADSPGPAAGRRHGRHAVGAVPRHPLATAVATTIGLRTSFAALACLAVVLVAWVRWKVPNFPGGGAAERVPLRRVAALSGIPTVLLPADRRRRGRPPAGRAGGRPPTRPGAGDGRPPEIRTATSLLGAYLQATGRRRPVLPLRLPGATFAGYRAGGHLAPDRAVGHRSWEQFLADQVDRGRPAGAKARMTGGGRA